MIELLSLTKRTINEFFMKRDIWIVLVIVVVFALIIHLYGSFNDLTERMNDLESDQNMHKQKIKSRCEIIEAYVSEGKLEEAGKEIVAWSKEISHSLVKEAIQINSRIANFLSRTRQGLISTDDESLLYNRLTADLLSLTQKIQG